MSAAIAIFVKTPGLSPLKTRLAAGIGKMAALEFYDLACEAVRSVAERATGLLGPEAQVYWAVAEDAGLARWKTRATARVANVVAQGEGTLGERLDRIYGALLRTHDEVYLIGADGPQIAAADFVKAQKELHDGSNFVLAPARDGGFWLMAGRSEVPSDAWTSVTYSDLGTFGALWTQLATLGGVASLPERGDVDESEDLAAMMRDFAVLPELTQEQDTLRDWAAALFRRPESPASRVRA